MEVLPENMLLFVFLSTHGRNGSVGSEEFSCLLCVFDLFLGSGVMYVTAYCDQLELVIGTWLKSDQV